MTFRGLDSVSVLEVELTQMGPIERASLFLRTGDRTMDNVQNCNSHKNNENSQPKRSLAL
jgi:hypothetical protein